MNYYNFLLFLSVISTAYIMSHALKSEGILNGLPANLSNFPYHVAIYEKQTPSSENRLACNGVLVSSDWILSIAVCLMASFTQPKRSIFSVYAGLTDINAPQVAAFRNLVYAFTYRDSRLTNHNIIMAKTDESFILSLTLNVIGYANPIQSFSGRNGLVSGFGSDKIRTENNEGENYLFIPYPDLKLRYMFVTVSSTNDCYRDFPYVDTFKKLCVTSERIQGHVTGACWKDYGSPLVIENQVVALSTETRNNCDDTTRGSLYYEVGYYHDFIRSIIWNHRRDYTVNHRASHILVTAF